MEKGRLELVKGFFNPKNATAYLANPENWATYLTLALLDALMLLAAFLLLGEKRLPPPLAVKILVIMMAVYPVKDYCAKTAKRGIGKLFFFVSTNVFAAAVSEAFYPAVVEFHQLWSVAAVSSASAALFIFAAGPGFYKNKAEKAAKPAH